MKRIYSFYDKEAITSIKITYDFPQPFYENLDRHLKEIFNPLFIKEINHRDKVIKIHSAYDSGKGMEYIPFVKVEKQDSFDDDYIPVIIDISNYTIEDLEQICTVGDKSKAVKLYGTFLNEMGVCPDMPMWIPEVSAFIENPGLVKVRIEYIKSNKTF
jgi:hypothetical protein